MTKRGEKMQAEILGLLRAAGSAFSVYEVQYAFSTMHRKNVPPTVYNALAALIKV